MQTLALEHAWIEFRKLRALPHVVLPMAVVQLLNAVWLIFPVQAASVQLFVK
jgi:hypothetical protein